jgi:TonB family protein
MYFDFEDRRPDTPLLDRPLTRLEQILITIIAYLLIVIGIIVYPRMPWVKAAEAARLEKLEEQRKQQEREDIRDRAQFVFVQPKVEIETKVPPKLAELSDRTRRAQTMEKAPNPKNDVAFSRGNSAEKIITDARKERTQPGEKPSEAAKGNTDDNGRPETNPNALALPTGPQSTIARNEPSRNPTLGGEPSGLLSDAIRNVNKYSQGESLQNVQGNGDFGPSIQFDTKGVEFGPWLRRFIAQIRRNWFVPYAAMSLRGNVVLAFKVHKDGSITDLQIMRPSGIDAFTKSAFNAIKLSNPTVPLPLEFPDENAPFIVTFYFNETPPGGGGSQ